MSFVPRLATSQHRQSALFQEPPRSGAAAAGARPQAVQRPRRIELLRERLPVVVGQLTRRRLDLVEEGLVADYLALRWLQWCDGELQLSEVGRLVRDSALQPPADTAAGAAAAGHAAEGSALTVAALTATGPSR